MNAEGKAPGRDVRQLKHGGVLVADVQGLPPGPHGFHIHETGVCEPPGLKLAGGHYAARKEAYGLR